VERWCLRQVFLYHYFTTCFYYHTTQGKHADRVPDPLKRQWLPLP
jgi:hypothetical protein